MKKVAIIDDDPMILDLYARKFKDSGHEIFAVNDRTFSLEKIVSFDPDVILLDLSMPSRSGIDILGDLQKVFAGKMPYVILLTNNDEKSLFEQAKPLGAKEYVVKAMKTPSEIVRLVEAAEVTR